jgi:hypothetical protein
MNWAKPPSSQHTASSSMMQERERSRASDSTADSDEVARV